MSLAHLPCQTYYGNDVVLACLLASGDPHSFAQWSGRWVEHFAHACVCMEVVLTAELVMATMGQAPN